MKLQEYFKLGRASGIATGFFSLHSLAFLLSLLFLFGGVFFCIPVYAGKAMARTTPALQAEANFSHGMIQAGETGTHFVQVKVTGAEAVADQNRLPLNVALVVDTSGSMDGEKIAQAKQAAVDSLAFLQEEDILSIVAYSNEAQVILPATRVGNGQLARKAIQRLSSGGGTALFAGVSMGAEELRKFANKDNMTRLVLFSDGMANVGPDSPAALAQLGQALAGEGMSVTTLGIGTGYNEELMARLAAASDGMHAFVEDSESLSPILAAEFSGLNQIVAQDIKLGITLAEGVKPVRSLGHEALIEAQQVEVSLNQLIAKQERYLLLEVEVDAPELAQEQGSEVFTLGKAQVSWRVGDAKRQEQILAASVILSEDVQAIAQSGNKEVLAAVVELRGAEVDSQVVELLDKGDTVQAALLLSNNASTVRQRAIELNDKKLMDYAERLEWDVKNWEAEKEGIRKDMISRGNAFNNQNRTIDQLQNGLNEKRNK